MIPNISTYRAFTCTNKLTGILELVANLQKGPKLTTPAPSVDNHRLWGFVLSS